MSPDARGLVAPEVLLERSIQHRLAANAVLGWGDPSPDDAAAAALRTAYLEAGGTEAEFARRWREVYDATPWRLGGGKR